MIECIQEEGDFTDWEVPSSSSDIKYIVSVDDEGNLFCSCLLLQEVQDEPSHLKP